MLSAETAELAGEVAYHSRRVTWWEEYDVGATIVA